MTKKNNLIFFIICSLFLYGCSNKTDEKFVANSGDIDLQMIGLYQEGLETFNKGFYLEAAEKFVDAENVYPQSIWAPKSLLMAAYSFYYDGYFQDSIFQLEKYIKLYPFDNNLSYAHYLLAMSHYGNIIDEKKDSRPILEAKNKFLIVINKFPNSEYAEDSKFKLDLINELLASKEMYLVRYYMKKEKWIPAINRLKLIIKDYESTVYVEEALHRLVEVNYKIGLEDEAKKYAVLLGHNYPESNWFLQSYKIFEKKEINTKDKILKNNKSKPKKLKSIF